MGKPRSLYWMNGLQNDWMNVVHAGPYIKWIGGVNNTRGLIAKANYWSPIMTFICALSTVRTMGFLLSCQPCGGRGGA
jgi:hypothetical protein